jgi:MoxR-like ATPase
MPRSWFFQANPKDYRIRAALAALKTISWRVKQNKDEIRANDVVYIWESGSPGGLLARARVVTDPSMGVDAAEEQPFHVKPYDNIPALQVPIEIEKVYTAPLQRSEVRAEPGLAETLLMRMPQGTNFPVTDAEAAVLHRLLEAPPTFQAVTRRLHSERVVFSSPEKGALYCIAEVDETGCDVARLSAQEPARVTYSLHASKVAALRLQQAPQPNTFLDNTVTIVSTLLQSPQLALTADRTGVTLLADEAAALDLFCEILGRLNANKSEGEPKLYKPAMIAAVVDAIEAGKITDHRIELEVVLPFFLARMQLLGQAVKPDQAAMPFFHLTGDLFWNLAYRNVHDRIEGAPTAAAIAKKMTHAVLKEPFGWLLRKHANRKRVLEVLAAAWWPEGNKLMRQPSVWWVNQGASYARERERGTIWCPQIDGGGNQRHFYTNVSCVKRGDVIFHYANKEIRAVSQARADANEGSKPREIAIDDEWQRPGWYAEVEYNELPAPLRKTELKEAMRRFRFEKGPFREDGDVIQGYLFPLNARTVCLLTERLANTELPPAISSTLQQIREKQWDEFVHWGRRFFETDDVRDDERKWKHEYATLVEEARDAVLNGSEDWFTKVKRAFTGNDSATNYRAHDKLLKWWAKNLEPAQEALRAIWNHDLDVTTATERFAQSIPEDALTGNGTIASIASLLISERGVNDLPLYRSDPLFEAYATTGCYAKSQSPSADYDFALQFFDRVIQEAAARDLVLPDRLDAQSLVWSVVKREPPSSWSELDRKALKAFRLGQLEDFVDPKLSPSDPIDSLADMLLIAPQFIRDTEKLLEAKGQLIFYGPPGTGKTYVAKALAKHFAGEAGSVDIVQFHPSYTYEDFVEGFRPRQRKDGEQPGFELVQGPLRRLATRARKNPDAKHVLIIDELNRGNVAKVFGELYFLLEYRNEAIRLQYDHRKKFSLPSNLWIIATMNTADRSIALIDAALRRRFYFLPFFPDEAPIDGLLERWLTKHRPDMTWVAEVVARANTELGDRHGAIGPSHFMRPELDDSWMELIWKHSVLPYLSEQFFGEEEQLKRFELQRLRNGSSANDGTVQP